MKDTHTELAALDERVGRLVFALAGALIARYVAGRRARVRNYFRTGAHRGPAPREEAA